MEHVGTSTSTVERGNTIYHLECSCGWAATPSTDPAEMTAQQEAHLAEMLADDDGA